MSMFHLGWFVGRGLSPQSWPPGPFAGTGQASWWDPQLYIDLAASLDRVERGSNAAAIASDPRMRLLRGAVGMLAAGKPDCATRMQMHFSDDYVAGWRDEFGMTP